MHPLKNMLWVEKYRPQNINELILPEKLRSNLAAVAQETNFPHLLFAGSPGVGKTSAAIAIAKTINADYIVINGSLHGNIDTLRNDITTFASARSLSGNKKIVIIDEADYLNVNSTQPALRNFLETYSGNCTFILTCNFKNRLIEALWSRCSIIDFKVDAASKPLLAKQIYDRLVHILQTENVSFEPPVIRELVVKYFPDMRRMINELQRYAADSQTIDTGILGTNAGENLRELIQLLKDRNYTETRKWVAENTHISFAEFARSLYAHSSSLFKPSYIPQLVITIADYQYKSAFAVDQEINTAAFLAEVMVEAEWK